MYFIVFMLLYTCLCIDVLVLCCPYPFTLGLLLALCKGLVHIFLIKYIMLLYIHVNLYCCLSQAGTYSVHVLSYSICDLPFTCSHHYDPSCSNFYCSIHCVLLALALVLELSLIVTTHNHMYWHLQCLWPSVSISFFIYASLLV